jgi:hypothetical protein
MDALRAVPTRIRTLADAKLGRCPRCIRSAVLGTVLSWAGLAMVGLGWPHPVALLVAGLLAAAFTLLLAGHLIVLSGRVAVALREVERDQPADGRPEAVTRSRREFAATVLQVSAAALTAALFGRWLFRPATALAQAARCGGGPQNIPANDATAQVGPVTVWIAANNARAAEAEAEKDPAARAQARAFGERFCTSIAACPTDALCALKNFTLSFRGGCARTPPPLPNPPPGTPAGFIPFNCTGRVTAVQCDCDKCAGEHSVPLGGVTVGGVNTPNTLSATVPADTAGEAKAKFERLIDPALKAAADAIVKAFCEAFPPCIRTGARPPCAAKKVSRVIADNCTGPRQVQVPNPYLTGGTITINVFDCTGHVDRAECQCKP